VLATIALGVFFWARGQGRDLETARTLVVNMFIAGELFYLFNVRYLHAGSISLRGVLGTPPVLIAVGVLLGAQALFTYAPFMQRIFDTRALPVSDLVVLTALATGMMLLFELEKLVLRRLGWLEGSAQPAVNA